MVYFRAAGLAAAYIIAGLALAIVLVALAPLLAAYIAVTTLVNR